MSSCSLSSWNWTSFFRKDTSIVPAVEAYFNRQQSVGSSTKKATATNRTKSSSSSSSSSSDSGDENQQQQQHTIPQTIDELHAFGETLETGDILIFHCTHTFGKIAQLLTRSVWDHVAMVVRLPTNDPDALQARMALIQQSPRPISDTMTWPQPGDEGPVEVMEAMGGGAFAYPFTAHVITRGDFCKYSAVRRLRHSQTGEPLSDIKRKQLEQFVQKYWARPYESGRAGMFELARPMFHRNPAKKKNVLRDKKQEALDNLFCSELITEALQAAELLPEETLNSNEILLSMFAPGQAIDEYLQDQDHGYTLGPVEIFKAPQTPLREEITERRAQLQHSIKKESATGKNDVKIKDEHLMKPQ